MNGVCVWYIWCLVERLWKEQWFTSEVINAGTKEDGRDNSRCGVILYFFWSCGSLLTKNLLHVLLHTSASLISSLSSMPSTVRQPWFMLSYWPASSFTSSFSTISHIGHAYIKMKGSLGASVAFHGDTHFHARNGVNAILSCHRDQIRIQTITEKVMSKYIVTNNWMVRFWSLGFWSQWVAMYWVLILEDVGHSGMRNKWMRFLR